MMKKGWDPFLEFEIGGDYQEVLAKGKRNKTIKIHQGKRGNIIFQTDVIHNLQSEQKRQFNYAYRNQIDLTYLQIQDEFFIIRVWDN